IDNHALTETARVATGNAPDGVGWDPVDKMVGVSDQADGALSLIAGAGSGVRTAVPLGAETGNVIFDAARGWFWITVVAAAPPDPPGANSHSVAVDDATHHVFFPLPSGPNGTPILRMMRPTNE